MSLGVQYIADFHGCDAALIDDAGYLEKTMRDTAARAGARVVESFFHQFTPHGISGVLIIAESHFTIHCWPEHRYAAVDFFSCSEVDAVAALRYLGERIGASGRTISSLRRGAAEGVAPPGPEAIDRSGW
ncbi:MAG: adenosylmethionine decarboxylase [Spirochaetes bacterium]|nr:adenosylmethionine decarboxylase [Spirochaetota bacterium]